MSSAQPQIVDLHTHTTASDGSLTPRELVAEAQRRGLRAVAISDHDTIAGVAEGLAAGRELGFEVVPGVELSCDFRGKTIHLLGYLFDPEHAPFHAKLAWAQEQRESRNARMVERFRELGIDMTLAEVEAEAGGGLIGRPHFAAVLVRKGAVASFDEAFKVYLSRHGKAYLPKVRFSAPEAIGLVRDAGGLPVWAHPMLTGWTPLQIDDAIDELQTLGLRGVETLYTDHNPAQVEILLDIARRRGLLTTGGSDFHGAAKPDTRLGRGRGDLAVPYAWLEALKKAKG